MQMNQTESGPHLPHNPARYRIYDCDSSNARITSTLPAHFIDCWMHALPPRI